jgi:hypothetical protein
MISLVFFIEQIAIGLYILIALGILLAWRSWRLARLEYRSTHFELERDLAQYRRANALTWMILLIELALVILGVQRVVAPTIRQTTDIAPLIARAADDGIFNTPTPSLSSAAQIDASGVQIGEDDPALRVLLTPTLTPTPVGTIWPNAQPIIGCDTPNATLQVPANGMQVFEPIVVAGTANIDNFAFYRIELKGPGTFDNFQLYQEHISPVLEMGDLGQFNPAPYAAQPGWYEFRLMIFDITTTLKASCLVNIYITAPVPTPTPLGQPTEVSAGA